MSEANGQKMVFAKKQNRRDPKLESADRWVILIVDDEPAVHEITRLMLEDYVILGRRCESLSALNAAEAKVILTQRDDISVVLLDVVMEEDDSGLKLVRYIREELNNHMSRILLRTGQPGLAPEKEVFDHYDINGYSTKTELTDDKFFTLLLAALRSFRDLMELSKAKRMAESAQRAKSNFLAVMSHELRTPLNGILGMAELIFNFSDSDSDRLYSRTILDSGRALLTVLSNMMQACQIETEGVLVGREIFEPEKLLRTQMNLFGASAKQKGIILTVECDDTIPGHVIGDAILINQILTNLISNAVKFTKEGKVTLRLNAAARNGKQLTLAFEVEDSGIGIPQDQLNAIFLPYTQLDESATRAFEGVGIGLTLVERLVKSMSGSIEVTSTVNQGTVFKAQIPVTEASLEDLEEESCQVNFQVSEELQTGLATLHVKI